MVPFAGWEMPVQYEGVIPEHLAVRRDRGVFDVSHMGQFHVEGPTQLELLQGLLSNDLARLADGEAQYTLLTNESGGIVDDLIAYRIGPFHTLLVVNAGNREPPTPGSRSARSAAPRCATLPTTTAAGGARARPRSHRSACPTRLPSRT